MKPQGREKSRCAEKPSSQNGYLCYCSVQAPETRLSGKVAEDQNVTRILTSGWTYRPSTSDFRSTLIQGYLESNPNAQQFCLQDQSGKSPS